MSICQKEADIIAQTCLLLSKDDNNKLLTVSILKTLVHYDLYASIFDQIKYVLFNVSLRQIMLSIIEIIVFMDSLVFKCNKKVSEKYDALIDKQEYKSANSKSVRRLLL